MSAMSANFAVAPAHVRSTAAIRRAGRASFAEERGLVRQGSAATRQAATHYDAPPAHARRQRTPSTINKTTKQK